MREIGGYFEWEFREGVEYHNGLYRFDAIRSALHFIIQNRNYSRVWIPRYLCGCIPELLTHIGVSYAYYPIQKDFLPLGNVPVQRDECLLFVNYYGQFTNNDLLEIHGRYPNVFVDNTHSFFQPPVANIDTAYTCRKYFGVPDGAYLSTTVDAEDYDQLPLDRSYMRMGYILGRYEVDANTFYKEYAANDSMFRGCPCSENVQACSEHFMWLRLSSNYKEAAGQFFASAHGTRGQKRTAHKELCWLVSVPASA